MLREQLTAASDASKVIPYYGAGSMEELANRLAEILVSVVCKQIKADTEAALATSKEQLTATLERHNEKNIKELHAMLVPIYSATKDIHASLERRGVLPRLLHTGQLLSSPHNQS